MAQTLRDSIAQSSITLYDTLPKHGKPTVRNNGVNEWTILSTISLVIPSSSSTTHIPSSSSASSSLDTSRVLPISLGTGVKVLPFSRLPPLGDALHDSHAEIIARRGFIRWLIYQASLFAPSSSSCANASGEEVFLERRDGKFRLKEGIKVWMYVSMLPCGDASTLHTAAHQSQDEAAQWDDNVGAMPQASDSTTDNLASIPSDDGSPLHVNAVGPTVVRGRNGYTNYSTMRTKPGRPDSIPSISMSCSDKIASWSVLGLQGALLEELFEAVWLNGLVIGGVDTPKSWEGSQAEWEVRVRNEVERALWGRLESIQDHLPPPYTLHKPAIHFTVVPFPHSKSAIQSSLPPSSPDPAPSPLSLSYIPSLSSQPKSTHKVKAGKPKPKPEIIANGTILSFVWKPPGKELMKEKGRSRISKFEILRAYEGLSTLLAESLIAGYQGEGNGQGQTSLTDNCHSTLTYCARKHRPGSRYQLAKTILRGHITPLSSTGTFTSLEQYGQVWTTDIDVDSEDGPALQLPIPPFRGWLVSGKEYEEFTSSGALRRG
ncbi:hypothetical protein CI109_104296 [Kwoniella shandongensis]|uniref:tRNA-specific adenosine deaminase 1 n=1 Tax=Kwoniella shandongensis TaxID=1734106 RepID=A0A5M6C582_9TREE|nr:uncharacterized protein CI109_002799 [Kwoniella shandongensis]KAA5528645.1 hypothetical protein CI109_002799 [Kwoniella shandongensis]